MLTLYWICFGIGGIFVLLSVFGGLDGADIGELDADLLVDSDLMDDLEVIDPGNRQHLRQIFRRAPPIFNLKFWTFGACFFGLTGLILSNLTVELSPLIIAIAAVSMGVLCGVMVASGLQALRQRQTDSLIRTDDLIGATGTVEIPFNKDSRGKVRLLVKNTLVDWVAYTDEVRDLHQGDRVLVVSTENDRLWVVSADRLDNAAERVDP